MIPSTRGSTAGLTTVVQRYDNTNAGMMIASPATTPDQSTTAPISVREFDEIVLNIQLIDNFGDTTAWGALSGHSFAQELKVKVLYSNMVDFVEMPPTLGSFPTSSTHWSSLLLEDVAVPFTGTVEVAEYAITIKNIQVGVSGNWADGTPSGLPTSPAHIERSINLRIPTTMAEWVAFVVDVDTSGGGFPDVWTTSPVVDFSVYRGLAL
jgi:hypothetical protein